MDLIIYLDSMKLAYAWNFRAHSGQIQSKTTISAEVSSDGKEVVSLRRIASPLVFFCCGYSGERYRDEL